MAGEAGRVAVIVGVAGGVVSTLKVRLAGLASRLPAPSTARTSNVCGPWESEVSCFGEGQDAQSPGSLESRRHSKPAVLSGEKRIEHVS